MLRRSLAEPQLSAGDAGGTSEPNPPGLGSGHQLGCVLPGKGSPHAGLRGGERLPAGRAGQGRASLRRDLPAGQQHARVCDPGATEVPAGCKRPGPGCLEGERGAAQLPGPFASRPSGRTLGEEGRQRCFFSVPFCADVNFFETGFVPTAL